MDNFTLLWPTINGIAKYQTNEYNYYILPRIFGVITLRVSILASIIMTLLIITPTWAQSDEYTGTMSDAVPDAVYPLDLSAGETITATAEATSGNLDTYLILQDSTGATIIENDDITFGNLNSQIVYTATADATYNLVLTNIRGTSGDYLLTITSDSTGESEFSAQSADQEDLLPDSDLVYTGYMSDDTPDASYDFYMEAGQGVIFRVDDTSGTLDPIAAIFNADDELVAYNDDRDLDDLNSQAVYVAEVSGTYTAVVSNYFDSSGEYEAVITITTAEAAEDRARLELSGERQTLETRHFVIHYTFEGEDATTKEYVDAVAKTLEEVYAVQIVEMGWPIPPDDSNRGGDGRYDVYITELISEYSGGDLGFTAPEFPNDDNPNTVEIETDAVPSYIALDNDYQFGILEEEIIPLMRATTAHEFHHAIQFGYDQAEPFDWYYEATATWMETVTLPPDQDASGYVNSVFTYPEICLGAQGAADPTGGTLMYGSWLFIQTLADAYGSQSVQELWRNIADYEGWEALNRTVANYGDTIETVAQRYHLQNLVRDYELAPIFEESVTVWSENTIDDEGTWTFTGDGIQQLAANYYAVTLKPGIYDVKLTDVVIGQLDIFAIGIRGTEADVFPLERGGTIDTSPYDYFNLMVFNAVYDDDVNTCDYESYNLVVTQSTTTPMAAAYSINAENYLPIEK